MNKYVILRKGISRVTGAIREELYLKSSFDVTKPETIRGIINQRCNFKCQYCYCWQRTEYPEISITEWKNALLSLKDYIGSYTIQFSGGEPFLKKGFPDLLLSCRDNRIDWGVITNGSVFTQKIVEKIVAAEPLNIDVSIDSPENAVNDYVRGAKGSLNIISKGFSRLTKERAKKNGRFIIRVKPTITRQNFRTLPDLVTWAGVHGADFIDFAPVRPEPFWDKTTYSRLWIDKAQNPELNDVIEMLVQMKLNGAPIETPVERLRSYPEHFLGHSVQHGASPCRVGMRDYFIFNTGNVKVCWEYPVIGNVTTQSAKEIWEGEVARKLRSKTIACDKFASMVCANSCLSHRTLKQEAARALQIIRLPRT
jgi:MoaA/NifB/PqqE/SkfB family radical SAM enzyme